MPPRSMETLVQHNPGISPAASPHRASVQFHMPNTDKPGLISRSSIQAAANIGTGLFTAVLPAGINASSNGVHQRTVALDSPTNGSPRAAAMRAPTASASTVALAASATAPGSLQKFGQPGHLGGGSAPRVRAAADSVWKVSYAFSTQVEKKLQQELEVHTFESQQWSPQY